MEEFDTKYDTTMNKAQKEIENYYKKNNKIIDYYDDTINAESGPKLTFDRSNKEVRLTSYICIDLIDKGDNSSCNGYIAVTMTYKSNRFGYSWEADD